MHPRRCSRVLTGGVARPVPAEGVAMAYDEKLAERVRSVLAERTGVAERRMFGGLAFLLDGKRSCGIMRDELIVRVGTERYEESLGEAHVRSMDVTSHPMRGWVVVAAAGCRDGKSVRKWVERAAEIASFARTSSMPPTRRASPRAGRRLRAARPAAARQRERGERPRRRA